MPTHTTTLSKSHFYARSFSLICLSLDRRPAGPWLGLHYADIGCFVAPKRRQLVNRPVLVPGSVTIFGRRRPHAGARCADVYAGLCSATHYRVHDGFWYGE